MTAGRRLPCLVLVLAAWVWNLAPVCAETSADRLAPATFAVSGIRVTASVMPRAVQPERFALEAFGRQWALSVEADKSSAVFDVPKVRVRTEFRIVEVQNPHAPVGELIAYPPDTKFSWDDELELALGPSVPAAIRQWLSAHQISFREWNGKRAERLSKAPGLLIIGRKEAGESFDDLVQLRVAAGRNLLVLDAMWYAQGKPRQTRIEPWCSLETAKVRHGDPSQKKTLWSARVEHYWPGVASRTGRLLAPDEDPKSSIMRLLVERVWVRPCSEAVTLSYLDWPSLLGRSDEIDHWFPKLLQQEASERVVDQALQREASIVWPPHERISIHERPVLARLRLPAQQRKAFESGKGSSREHRSTAGPYGRAAVFLKEDHQPEQDVPPVLVLDLRGPHLSAKDAASIILPDLSRRRPEVRRPPLIILGTDPRVGGGAWAKFGSKTHSDWDACFDAVWLPEDQLPIAAGETFESPSSRLQQIYRLTLLLTQYGVFVTPMELTSPREHSHGDEN